MRDLNRRSFFSIAAATAAVTLAAACGDDGDQSQDKAHDDSGRWEYTDDLGIKVSLPQRPRRVVAYVSGAAALWDFGVRPVGVYGPTANEDGTPILQAGNIDIDAVESVGGEDYNGINVESLLALEPDLVIASLAGQSADSRWVIKDDIAQIEKVAPVYSIQETGKPLPEIISAYQALAERLGAESGSAQLEQAQADFEAAGGDLQDALAQKPGLRAEFVYADTGGFYVASPAFYPTLLWYQQLGMTIARQDASPGADFLEQLSWEQVNKYPSDLILTDIRTFSLPQQQIIEQFPTFANLPAVKAKQLGDWNGEPRFSYQQGVSEVRDLARSVRAARPSP